MGTGVSTGWLSQGGLFMTAEWWEDKSQELFSVYGYAVMIWQKPVNQGVESDSQPRALRHD